jgi:O-antigen/teichoic acid export membrane protein
VSSSLSLCLLFAIPILVGGELLSSTIVLVFAGQAFSPSVRTFQILLGLVLPVSLSTVLVFQVLLASGREHLYNFVIVGELALFVLLNAVFVSLWNQDGAAAALVITELFGLVAVALLSRGLGVVALDWKNTFKTLSAALVMGVVVMLLQQGLLTGHNPELLVLVLCTVAGILVYGGCLAVFREENTNKFVRLILSKA